MDRVNSQALEIRALTSTLAKLAGQQLERRLQANGADISTLQYGVLRRLSRQTATISELSSGMMLAPATLVPVVDALEQKGLVERGHDKQDRRRKSLTVTASGLQLLQRLPQNAPDDAIVHGLLDMGDLKAQQLIDLLGELITLIVHDDQLVPRMLSGIRSQR